jgi:peptidoglycan/xylan/chitin deacetylase (PgdA/CDA1 family)
MNTIKSIFLTNMAFAAVIFMISCSGNSGNKSAKDSAATATKPIPGTPIKYDSSKRYIFLTWDDAPQPPGTLNCKAVFKQEGVKATFFVVGFNQVGPQKKRIIDSLRNEYPQFLIANHSFSHGFKDNYKKFYQLTDSAMHDFLRNEQELQVAVKIIRLPGRNTWASNGKIHGQEAKTPLIKRLDSLGYKIIGWDLEWGQQKRMKAPQEGAEEMAKRVNQQLEDGNTNEPNAIVILSHDRLYEKQQYVDSLSRFISILKQDPRNVFETIDHYPAVQRK